MYYTKDNLPDFVKKMPAHAQDIWMAAFNSAFGQYKDEDRAMATAMAAVKEKYHQDESGMWSMMAAFSGGIGRVLAAAASSGEDKGWRWDVQIIQQGEDLQGRAVYPLDVLHEAAPLYEGAPVFALSTGQHNMGQSPSGNSVRDLVGRVQDVTKNSTGLAGKLVMLKTAANQWLRDALVNAEEQGMLAAGGRDILGLSHDVIGAVQMQGGKRVARKIVKVNSVDVVYEPIGGGKFLRMAASRMREGHKEEPMFKQLLAALKAQRPDLAAKIAELEAKGDAATVEEIVAAALTPKTEGAPDTMQQFQALLASMTEVTSKQAQDLVAAANKKFEDSQKLIACSTMLVEQLHASELPEILQAQLRKSFAGKIFTTEELKAAIVEQKTIADKLTGSGLPEGGGALRATVTEGEPERLQAATDKLLGGDVDEKFKDVPAFTSLKAAYVRLTGDTGFTGFPSRDGLKLGDHFMRMMNLPAAYSSGSFSFVLGNSMTKRLLKEYRAPQYHEDAIISFKKNVGDFKTQEIIQIGYFADLADVNPENADYAEITMPTDVEATYTLNQKGNILTVTRRVLVNDDLKSVVQLVSKLGRSARRTHAKRAWNKIISNATFKGDSKALFHADHGNLGATTLTLDATGIATLTARLKAMYAQTEQDSGEGLALTPKWLWVPRDLLEIAQGLNSKWEGTTANPHAGRFGANHEFIICHPFFTDTNDWGMVADGADVDLLEAGYMNGRTEPEFFVADNPTVGQMFVADKLQYKIRHEYEFEIADYRGFDKSVA